MTYIKIHYPFETVVNDTLNGRIYTLPNDLKVFLSVFPEEPRIQTYIAVHVGSKMDPPDSTGLAHYFEHMMFKGTQSFGTRDWEQEELHIDRIEQLFEQYRHETDPGRRDSIYRQIDALSLEASKVAIPNEYDKMMDLIGSQGSNAGTSNDYTIYMENIPSNEVENWAKIQSERFSKPVLRLFHTELETVYEEKNMSLTNDSRKVNEAIMKALFPNHPYGRQTTLGEAEHLKNPSMKNIRDYFTKYYVPNNMAICISGDLDPDEVIPIIDHYFSKLVPAPVPPLKYETWKIPELPIFREVTGLEAESIRIGFGLDVKANDKEANLAGLIGLILYNGTAGLIDLHLNQSQQVLNASALTYQLADYGMIILDGKPKRGQTLEDVKDLLLWQVDQIRKGEFPDWMPEAVANNARCQQIKQYETNQGRAMAMANAYVNDIPYSKLVSYIDEISKITYEDIITFANKYLCNNFVVVYKRQGNPEEVTKIVKPPITPVYIERDQQSDFLKSIKVKPKEDIKPVFIDYHEEIEKFTLPSGYRVLYKQNLENCTYELVLHFRFGRNHDKVMNYAMEYLPFLGSVNRSALQIRQELYKFASAFVLNSSEEETTVTIMGLNDHFEKVLEILEELLDEPVADQEALDKLVANTLKSRIDAQSNNQEIFSALESYGIYGEKSVYKNILSEKELKEMTPERLVKAIKMLKSYRHDVIYYGPSQPEVLQSLLVRYHNIPSVIKEIPDPVPFQEVETSGNRVFFFHHDTRQSRLESIVRNGRFDPSLSPVIVMFNNYFGNNIVFQELREKRGLAYTAYSRYKDPIDLVKSALCFGYIATQNDKVIEALNAFEELYNSMPLSENTFSVTRDAVLNKIRTERITRIHMIFNMLKAEKRNLGFDIRREIFSKVSTMSLQDMITFNSMFIKNKTKTYVLLGKEENIDFPGLARFGPVTKLGIEDIFGY